MPFDGTTTRDIEDDETLRILIGVRALLDAPSRWLRHRTAKSICGHQCAATAPDAYAFCLMGAIIKVQGTSKQNEVIAQQLRFNTVQDAVWWNDYVTSHAELLQRLDRAIADRRRLLATTTPHEAERDRMVGVFSGSGLETRDLVCEPA